MAERRRKAWLGMLWWFAVSEIAMLLLDVFMSTITPEYGNVDTMRNFDLSVVSPFLYISCWTSFAIAVWAICKIVDVKSKANVARWVVSRNNSTFIVSMSTIMFLVYGIGFVAAPQTIVGADTWYKVLKSTIEHFINPILMIIFYLLFVSEEVNSKEYAQKWGWLPLIFTTSYILFVVIREAMLVSFSPAYQGLPWVKEPKLGLGADGYFNKNGLLPAFPYESIDPFVASPKLWVSAFIGIEAGIYVACNLFNWLGNMAFKSMDKRGWIFDIYAKNQYKKSRAN